VTLDIAELAGLRVQAEWVMLEKRGDGASWRRAWNDRDRWHPKWSKAFMELFTRFDQQYNFQLLVKRGLDAWSPGRLKRRPGSVPPASAISAVMQTQVAADQFQDGAMAVYMDLALNEAEAAGQRTLEALGLNETFAWANIRDFPENPYAVRGSKILQNLYGNHRERLARLVLDKTKPDSPKTIGQLTREIRAEWPRLAAKDADMIARTEAANVWETTNWNAMYLNNVQEVEWLIASGPSIGPPKSYPVCKECLERAANSPYHMIEMESIPPLHPRCRCTVVQKYNPEWLPPAEPWTGAATKLEVFV
jgi:hypothetical protein